MAAQSTSSTPSWKCTGTSIKQHAEAINNTNKCQYCEKTFKNPGKINQITIRQKILFSFSCIAAILAACIAISAIVNVLGQTKSKLQQKEQVITKGSKCVRLIGEINNTIWQGVALNTDAVVLIQQQLKSLGFYQGEIDGTFGHITRKAVKDFQQSCQASLD